MTLLQDLSTLSRRENEILQYVSMGNDNKTIAALLEISPETVKKHMQKIFTKLQVHNKIQALNKMNLINQHSNIQIANYQTW